MTTPDRAKKASIARDIARAIVQGDISSRQQIEQHKKRLCKRYGLDAPPANSELLEHVPAEHRQAARPLLQKKPVRTLSGVAVVAVMTSPHPCPHGRCVPCPGGPPQSAQSYTGREPAAQRAIHHDYDPYQQTAHRIQQLEVIGHPADKIHLIVMGGTFTARPLEYQRWFIRRCLDAMNDSDAATLDMAQRRNEQAPHRCIGMTVETRPDWARLQHVDRILDMGATRIELGVQILDDRVLSTMERGHTVQDIRAATRICRDAGLKICYHVMPGLPGSSRERDDASFAALFDDPSYRPDMLKIYPTLVVAPSELQRRWRQGNYEPLSTGEATQRIAAWKAATPPWVRIQRVQRDVPAQLIDAGVQKSNLRQLVHEYMEAHGQRCSCIRCREVGHRQYKQQTDTGDVDLVRRRYEANGGMEHFLSMEDENGALVGYCRLRFPGRPHRPEIEDGDALVRELKVTGPLVPLGREADGAWQHRGYGHRLLREAERIAADADMQALLVLSGVGARAYYRNQGYHRRGVYMARQL